jgi:hypothetical protein
VPLAQRLPAAVLAQRLQLVLAQRLQLVLAPLPEAHAQEPLDAAVRLQVWVVHLPPQPLPPPQPLLLLPQPTQEQQLSTMLLPQPHHHHEMRKPVLWAAEWVACPPGLHTLVLCLQVRHWGSQDAPCQQRLHSRPLLAAFDFLWHFPAHAATQHLQLQELSNS